MKKKSKSSDVLFTKRLVWIALGTAAILAIPLVAMQFSDEVNWQPFDFAVMGTLLFGTGLVIDQILTKVKNKNHKLALAALLLIIFLYFWAELAVGVFTNWGS
jgi:uncharacterized membrane protein